MATSLSVSLALNILATLTKTQAPSAQSASMPLTYNVNASLTNGSGAGNANKMWSDTRTLAASANESLDLNASLTDVYGASLVLTRVAFLLIFAAAANTNNLIVGAGSNPFLTFLQGATDAVIVRPGGFVCAYAPDATGYVVTASTGDILKIANSSSGTGVTYDIVVIGS